MEENFHDPIDGMKDSLAAVIQRTVDRGGKIIVPSFSVERTQEIVYLLSELFDEGRLPVIPIYVDSPLAVDATDIFRIHPECFDQETIAHINAHQDPVRLSSTHLCAHRRSIQRVERIAFAMYDYCCIRYVRSGAHCASSCQQYRKSEQHDYDCRVSSGTYAGQTDCRKSS